MYLIFLCLFFMILCSTLIREGIKQGMIFLAAIFIPSVLPYIFITNLIIQMNYQNRIGHMLHPFFKKIFHCSESGAYAMFIGLLCGYPVGAITLSSLYSNHSLSKREACTLLALINNPSIGFIVAYLLNALLNKSIPLYIFLLCYYFPIFLVGYIITKNNPADTIHLSTGNSYHYLNKLSVEIFNTCIKKTIQTLCIVCSYILCFSTISYVGFRLTEPINKSAIAVQTIFSCLCEITSGFQYLFQQNWNLPIKVSVSIACLHLGGLSAITQTKGCIESELFYLTTYIKIKCCLAIVSVALISGYFIAQIR